MGFGCNGLACCQNTMQMIDAWGGWSLFQVLLRTLKGIASKHGVSIPTVAVRYILDQVFRHKHCKRMSFPSFFDSVWCLTYFGYTTLDVAARCGRVDGWSETWFGRTHQR